MTCTRNIFCHIKYMTVALLYLFLSLCGRRTESSLPWGIHSELGESLSWQQEVGCGWPYVEFLRRADYVLSGAQRRWKNDYNVRSNVWKNRTTPSWIVHCSVGLDLTFLLLHLGPSWLDYFHPLRAPPSSWAKTSVQNSAPSVKIWVSVLSTTFYLMSELCHESQVLCIINLFCI